MDSRKSATEQVEHLRYLRYKAILSWEMHFNYVVRVSMNIGIAISRFYYFSVGQYVPEAVKELNVKVPGQ